MLTALTAFLLAAGPLPAADSSKRASDQQIQVTGRKIRRAHEDPDRVVCKVYQATGSRVFSKKECKTQARWDFEELETAMALQRLQARDGGDENPQTPHKMP